MNLPKCWLKQFKNHAYHLTKLSSHIFFLSNCHRTGVIPLGLTSKNGISGMPPSIHQQIKELGHQQSLVTLETLLGFYENEHTKTAERFIASYELIKSTSPNLTNEVAYTIYNANNLLTKLNNKKLEKLSKLYLNKLNKDGFIEVRPTTIAPPLVGEKPSLSDILKIPTPVGQLPVLPRKIVHRMNQATTEPEDQPPIGPTPPETCIHNISSHNLTDSETAVLSKGLTFTPTSHLDQFALASDIVSFGRNLRLKYFFKNNPSAHKIENLDPSLIRFKPASNFDPPPLPPDHPIELYINFLLQKCTDPAFFKQLPTNHNLSPEERKAIHSLKTNPNIMILPADKGSTTVVMDKVDYMNEVERQLSDSTTYKKLDHDPTTEFNEELKSILLHHAKHQDLSTSTQILLVNDNPTPPQFYVLPKIHKNVTPPPGRPIVASNNSVTERISAFVDDKLQPLVKKQPSYVQDTNHFLTILSSLFQTLPDNAILVTIDAVSLYTNIPHAHGLAAIEHFLNQRPSGSKPSTAFLVQLAKFILEKNHFQSSGNNYLQIKGTAMGTRMAPSYANLFMARLEQNFLQKQTIQPTCWLRFIDDIFMIWTDSQPNLETFLNNLQAFSTVNFTWQTSTEKIVFLDVEIKLKNGFLSTDIHIKPTNKQQYLHFSSCHPNNTKRSLPFSLATRANRIISDPEDLDNYNKQLSKAFQRRGYPGHIVNNQIRLAQTDPNSRPQRSKSEVTPLVTTYHHGLQKLNSFLKDGFNILKASPHTKDFLEKPPTVTFRQQKNLKQLLVHPKLPDPKKSIGLDKNNLPGSYPCNRKACKTCPIHQPATTFTSSSTALKYKIPGHHTCDSSNIIYQLQCNHCPAQYIGLTTQTLRSRMNGHRQDCKVKNLEKPVSQHSNLHNKDFDSCYSTKVVRSLPPEANPSQIRRMELAHQWITKSRDPPNLNIR